MPTDSLHVVIIGAGYAGLALAHSLRRARVSYGLTEPLPAWRSSNITLVGDAIHPLAAGPRAGANTACGTRYC